MNLLENIDTKKFAWHLGLGGNGLWALGHEEQNLLKS
jgi:hypothetical protein